MCKNLQMRVITGEFKKKKFPEEDLWCSKVRIWNLEFNALVQSKFCMTTYLPLKAITGGNKVSLVTWRDRANEFE